MKLIVYTILVVIGVWVIVSCLTTGHGGAMPQQNLAEWVYKHK